MVFTFFLCTDVHRAGINNNQMRISNLIIVSGIIKNAHNGVKFSQREIKMGFEALNQGLL
jgi:hypothetical protein